MFVNYCTDKRMQLVTTPQKMRYVRTIDKTTEVATPRGVTPCPSDPKVEERMIVFYTLTLKFLPVGRILQQNPLTLSFHGLYYNIVVTPL